MSKEKNINGINIGEYINICDRDISNILDSVRQELDVPVLLRY